MAITRRQLLGVAGALGGLAVPNFTRTTPAFMARVWPAPHLGGGRTPIINLPPQPATIAHGFPVVPSAIVQYAHPGGMVNTPRGEYTDSSFQTVSNGGGHVLFYIDPIVWNTVGTYHDLLFNANTINGTAYSAVPEWPGPISANDTGNLADFRTTSVMHTEGKLAAVLRKVISDNSFIAGFFMDDVGSRAWFPNFDWTTMGTTFQNQYRAGAIQVCQTVRDVCNERGLIFLVNGTWTSGTVASNGGGYPTLGTHGNALADGGTVEHHDATTEMSFWSAYMDESGQWAEQSPVTNGKAFHLVVSNSSSDTTLWRNDGKAAWVTAAQISDDYGGVAPWGTVADFHPTGLPSHT